MKTTLLYSLLAVLLTLQEWVPVMAQPFRSFQPPDPTPWNLRAFNPISAVTPSAPQALADLEKLVSKGTLFYTFASHTNPDLEEQGTGFLIRTDPNKSYVCMVTAGHVMTEAGISPSAGIISPEQVYFNYVRNRAEVYTNANSTEINDDLSLTYTGMRLMPMALFAMEYTPTNQMDYALLGIPKVLLPASYYQIPYSFPAALTIPTTLGSSLFSIHHAASLPQRVSELSSAYADPAGAQANHGIATATNAWDTRFWSYGGFQHGASGAALIQPYAPPAPLALQPMAIGLVASGPNNAQMPYFSTLPAATQQVALSDISKWYTRMSKLASFQSAIRQYCGLTDAEQQVGLSATNTQIIPSQAQTLTGVSNIQTALGRISYSLGTNSYQHILSNADIIMKSFSLSGTHLLIHVGAGNTISLEDGFSVQADNTVSMVLSSFSNKLLGSTARQAAQSLDSPPSLFTVFPNPTNGWLTISPPNGDELYSYQLLDSQGKVLVEELTPTPGVRQLQLKTNLPNGSYLLKIQSQNHKSEVHKVILNQ